MCIPEYGLFSTENILTLLPSESLLHTHTYKNFFDITLLIFGNCM